MQQELIELGYEGGFDKESLWKEINALAQNPADKLICFSIMAQQEETLSEETKLMFALQYLLSKKE